MQHLIRFVATFLLVLVGLAHMMCFFVRLLITWHRVVAKEGLRLGVRVKRLHNLGLAFALGTRIRLVVRLSVLFSRGLLLCAHMLLNSVQIFLGGSEPQRELLELAVEEDALLVQLIVLEGKAQHLFLVVPLLLHRRVLILLINLHACLQLSGLRLETHVLLMQVFNFFHVAFGLLFQLIN